MIITISEPVTCVELQALLGLPVLQITREGNEVIVKVQATEAQITADHKAVLTQAFPGQTVSLDVN